MFLSPQEEERTSSYWEDNKIYTSGSIANLQRTPNEINESGAIASKANILVGQSCQTFKNI